MLRELGTKMKTTIDDLGLVRGTRINSPGYGSGTCNAFDRYNKSRVFVEFENHYDHNPSTGHRYEWITTDQISKEWNEDQQRWILT